MWRGQNIIETSLLFLFTSVWSPGIATTRELVAFVAHKLMNAPVEISGPYSATGPWVEHRHVRFSGEEESEQD